MVDGDEFEAMAEACITNHHAIMEHGSPEMKLAARLLLYALAEEIRRRDARGIAAPEDDPNA